jgi:hypothetical protein
MLFEYLNTHPAKLQKLQIDFVIKTMKHNGVFYAEHEIIEILDCDTKNNAVMLGDEPFSLPARF